MLGAAEQLEATKKSDIQNFLRNTEHGELLEQAICNRVRCIKSIFLKLGVDNRMRAVTEWRRVMASRLAEILDHIHKPTGIDNELLNLAQVACPLLTNRDVQWTESVKKLYLKPA